ncbi:MAG: hypothetical protein R2784_13455 [Saprospiraceae bacterium]
MVFALSAYSQSNNINALHQYLNPNLQKGIYASLQFDFNRSNEILEKINPEDFSKVDYVIAQMHLGSNLLWQLKYEQFNTLKEDLYRYCDENHLDQLKLRATILDALYLAHKRRFLPALNNLNASLNQYHLLYNQEHPDWYLWQPYLAFLYHFSQSDFLMSEKLYFSTIDRFDKAFSETIAITRVLELLQAILYHYQADIELAEQILLKNIQLCEADSFCSSSLLSTLNAWAATFEFNQNNYHEALPFINKAISSARTNFQITKALGVKNNYFGYIGNINACRNYFEEAKNHAMRLGVQEEYVQLVENYATVLAKNNQYSLIKELEIELDLLPQKEYKSSYGGNTYIPRILFWYCLEQKYFEQALVYYNKFLENSFQSVQETNGWKNLNIEKFPIHVNSPSVFYMKAKLAFEYWDKHKEVEKLQIAMDAALKCDSLFQLITSRFSNQHSIEKYLVEQDSYIDFFIGVSLQNYLTTTSHQNLQKLIYFISRSQDFDLFL